jgi:thiol-disulfide isomerase/thioredoxin
MKAIGLLLCIAAAASAAEFTLTDANGKAVAARIGGGEPAVVMFLSTVCPVSNGYNTRIGDLYREYSAKGMKFIFINSNQNESLAAIREHARSAGFPFQVYKDSGNAVADRLGAQYTPEAFLFDGAGKLRYHGRIDDSQNPARVTQSSLRLAIDAVLAGHAVATPEAKGFGCVIKRARRTS